MTGSPVGWGFIGTSGWVESQFAPTVRAAGHRVVGAFGSSPAGSARFAEANGATPYRSLDELLADDAVEAVWVASPTSDHAAHARAAAEAGRAVLVEKPLTVEAAEAEKLVDELTALGVLAGVAFQHRFNPGVAALAAALADGRIGALSSLLVQHAVNGPRQPTPWRTDPARSGGWSVSDLGTHLLDIAQSLVGQLDFRAARLSSPGRALAVDDLSWLLLSHGEATVVMRASTGTPGPPPAIEVVGTSGWLRLVGFWGGGGVLYDSTTGTETEIVAEDPYLGQVRAFAAAVRGEPWTGASLRDGLAVTRLVAAAREFTASGVAIG